MRPAGRARSANCAQPESTRRSSPASRSTAITGSAPCRISAISTWSTTDRNTATILIRAVNDFFKRFEAKYGKKADVSYGLRGYSAIQAWAKAANKAGTLDGAKVAAVLDTFNKEPLVIGPTSYTPDLHIQTRRPMSIIGVTDGKFSASAASPWRSSRSAIAVIWIGRSAMLLQARRRDRPLRRYRRHR